MRPDEIFAIIFIAFAAIISAFMFLEGFFHGEANTKFRMIIDLDKIFFPKLQNKKLIAAADRLAFLICLLTSFLILTLGAISISGLRFIEELINLSVALIFIAIVSGWITRYIFIYIYKDKPTDKIPRIWPFKKAT
jgi:hypothetical protein